MKVTTFNVLADAYLSYGDYSHVDKDLLIPDNRIKKIIELIYRTESDILGIQEAEQPLVDAIKSTGEW